VTWRFVKDGLLERFYVRSGVTTLELPGSPAQEYIAQRTSLNGSPPRKDRRTCGQNR
jgi:hypothetical protein